MDAHLKAMVRVAKSRLLQYETLEQCGQWNCNVVENLRNDAEFESAANVLHETVLQAEFTEWLVDDGHSVSGVDIEIGTMLTVRFKLCFLSPTYFYTPAEFSLYLNPENAAQGTATYRCGTRSRNGEVKLNSKNCAIPYDLSEWAITLSCKFGGGLSSML